MGFLFGGPRRPVRNRGLIGSLFGGNQYRYQQPRRRGLLSNPLVGMLAMGALGYAAKRFLGGNQGYSNGGNSFDAGGGGSVWGQGDDNNSFGNGGGQSW